MWVDEYILSCDLDEFAQQLNSFAHGLSQTHFRDDPVLDLVEPA